MIILISILLSFSGGFNAQTTQDSLWKVWNNQSLEDSIRLGAMEGIIKDGTPGFTSDSLIQLAKMQYSLAEKSGIIAYQASATYKLGDLFESLEDYSTAIDYYNQSLEQFRKVRDLEKILACLRGIGLMYKYQGNYAQAIDFYIQGLRIEEQRQNELGVSGFLLSIGNIYLAQADYDTAIEYYSKCQEIKERIKDTLGISYAINNAGYCYYHLGDLDKAKDYYTQSLDLKEYLGDKKGMANSLNNIGLVFFARGDYDTAMEYYQRSLEIKESLGDKKGMANQLNNIGRLYREKGDYSKAISFSEQALTVAEDLDAIMVILDASRSLYETYKLIGNSSKALEMFELETETNREILSERNQREVLRQEYQYNYDKQALADSLEFAKKEAIKNLEIDKQKASVAKQRIALAASGGGVLLLFFLALSIRRGKKRSDELLHNILPVEVASELKEKGQAKARLIDEASILFTDFQGFTALTKQLSPQVLVQDIHYCFSAFDEIMQRHGIEKIKTIGDAYMAAGGLPVPNQTHAKDVVLAALEIVEFIQKTKSQKLMEENPFFEIRIGVNSGPVVAGIVGVKKFSYDIWGDTVNTASRLESHSEIGKVNISKATYLLLKDDPDFQFESRGEFKVKGKGDTEMWFVSRS